MDSITQASLGALCGEIVLGRQLGYKGALWGLLFGTLPDLDVLAFKFLSESEQLLWHRGLSHSILLMIVGAVMFGWLLKKFHSRREINFWRFFVFVFLAWSTHVLIDCFNTYGTQIMEPFSSSRYSISNIAIIDFFFLLPMLLGLLLTVVIFRKRRKLRTRIGWVTVLWLCFYFGASLFMKHKATEQFKTMLAERGIKVEELEAAPTFSNIFLWRMHARDSEKFYVSYWSIFDDNNRKSVIKSFGHGHELDKDFEDSVDYQRVKWFCRGWHKTFVKKGQPNSIYIAAINMNEAHFTLNIPENGDVKEQNISELRPVFIWKITKTDSGYEFGRPFKMTKDGYSRLLAALGLTYQRVKGDAPNWMGGSWSWDLDYPIDGK